MTAFNPADRATWLDVLTLAEVALILRRPVGGIRKACELRVMVPAPARDLGRPMRWRKADVVRHIDGATVSRTSLRKVV